MNRKEAIEGIAPYKHEQQVLLRLLRKHGKLTEKDFDRIFLEFRAVPQPNGIKRTRHRRVKLRFCTADRRAFILGSLFQGEWAKWLNLLKVMIYVGLVSARTENNLIVYRAVTITDPQDPTPEGNSNA